MKLQLQKTLDFKQHIATLQNHGTSKDQTCPETSTSSSQPYPDAQPYSSAHPPQPVIRRKFAIESPVVDLQIVKQVQAESEPHMVAGLFSTPPQMQKPLSHTSAAPNRMLNLGNIVCWKNSDYSQNSQPHQNPQPEPTSKMDIGQQAQIVKFCSIPNSMKTSAVKSPQIMKNPVPLHEIIQKRMQEQLFQFLQSPTSAQEQQQVLTDVKYHPYVQVTAKLNNLINEKKQLQLKQVASPNLPVSPQPNVLCHPQAQVLTSQQEVKSSPPSTAHFAQAVSAPHPIISSKNQNIVTLQNQGISETQTCPENSNSSSPPYLVAHPHLSAHPPQPVNKLKPSTGPPVVDLQVQAKKEPLIVAASVNHKQTVISPAAYADLFSTPPQMQKPISQMMSDAQNCQPHKNPQPQPTPKMNIGQQEQIVKSCSMTNCVENSAVETSQIVTNSVSPLENIQRLVAKLEWQQLLQTLNSLVSFEQQQKVLAILKSNPQLMTSFKKQESVQQQQMLITEGNMITSRSPIYLQCANEPIPVKFDHHQEFQEDSIQFQRVLMQHRIKQVSGQTHLPVSPQLGILSHPQAQVPTSQQEIKSPDSPQFVFPQAIPSIRLNASTKTQNQPIPFPQRQLAPSPFYPATHLQHSSHSVGTSRLSGPDQMSNNDDMMLSHLTSRVSSHSDLTGDLPGPVNQELELSSTDNMDLVYLTREKQPDEYNENLTYYFYIYCILVLFLILFPS